MQDLPLPPPPRISQGVRLSEGARAWGIVGLVAGIIGFLMLPFIFGPVGLVAGIVAIKLRNQMGWWGVALGGFATAIAAYNFYQLSAALQQLG